MKEFLQYWAKSRDQQDDARSLFSAHQSALAALESSRQKTHGFIIPLNGSKGWHPGFDPDETEQVVALAAEIDARKAALKSIAQEIEAFVAVAGGPTFRPLSDQIQAARRRVSDSRLKAKAISRVAMNTNPSLSPAEIQELPEVLEANLALVKTCEEFEPVIADLTTRIEKAREILKKRGE